MFWWDADGDGVDLGGLCGLGECILGIVQAMGGNEMECISGKGPIRRYISQMWILYELVNGCIIHAMLQS